MRRAFVFGILWKSLGRRPPLISVKPLITSSSRALHSAPRAKPKPRDIPPGGGAAVVRLRAKCDVSQSEEKGRKTTCCDGVNEINLASSRAPYICYSPRVSRTASLRIVESRLLTKGEGSYFKHGRQDDRPAAVSRYMQQRVGHAIHTLSAYATHGPSSTGLLAAAAPDGSCSPARCRSRQWSSGRQAACRRR